MGYIEQTKTFPQIIECILYEKKHWERNAQSMYPLLQSWYGLTIRVNGIDYSVIVPVKTWRQIDENHGIHQTQADQKPRVIISNKKP